MNIIDLSIIVLYLIGITFIGIFTGGRQKSSKDYFMSSESLPWQAVTFSIVAAETSTLTFISIPGLAYLTNLNFIQVTLGYLLGRIVVAHFFIPAYYQGKLETAYSFLENRIGLKVRSFASIVFLFTRIAADGVRLFATAIPLKLLLGINFEYSILIIAVVALLYTGMGGVKGIIWVDVIQMILYLGGAAIAIYYLIFNLVPGGIGEVISFASENGRLNFLNTGFDLSLPEFFKEPYTLLGGLLGGAFLSMASHGTDQLVVQRLLTIKNVAGSKKALISSGVLVIIQFAIFLFLGVVLFSYYQTENFSSLGVTKADEIFPLFIINELPTGISGLIIAGLFAAALSTLAGSISSLSSSFMMDVVKPFKLFKSVKNELTLSRIITFIFAVILSFSALAFIHTSQAVVVIALGIASFTYGGLLGTFLLGLVNKKITEAQAIGAFVVSIFVMSLLIISGSIAWTWYTFAGVLTTLITGYICTGSAKIFNSKKK